MKTWIIQPAILILALCALGVASRSSASNPLATQDVTYLSQRLNTLEQRVFNIESSINQLRSQAMTPSVTSPTIANPAVSREEVALLRTEITLLQRQMADAQCGLLKLDQRTLPAAARAQLTPAEASDPCRRLADTPIRIGAR